MPGVSAVMYFCVRGIEFASLCDFFLFDFWKSSDSVVIGFRFSFDYIQYLNTTIANYYFYVLSVVHIKLCNWKRRHAVVFFKTMVILHSNILILCLSCIHTDILPYTCYCTSSHLSHRLVSVLWYIYIVFPFYKDIHRHMKFEHF